MGPNSSCFLIYQLCSSKGFTVYKFFGFPLKITNWAKFENLFRSDNLLKGIFYSNEFNQVNDNFDKTLNKTSHLLLKLTSN